MRHVVGVAVVLMVLGWAAIGLSPAGLHQSHGVSTESWRLESRIQAPAPVPPGQEADYPCPPPIGTEGPPARDLPESVTCFKRDLANANGERGTAKGASRGAGEPGRQEKQCV